MNALDLITPGLAPLKAETLCEDALMYLNHWNIGNLPVIVDGKPFGLIHSSDLALASPKDAIKGLVKTEVSFLIFQGAHIFDVLKVLGESAHHALAVLNEKGEVLGVVSPGQALFGKMQKFNAILKGNVPVGMVSLQMRYQDYFLSEIARIAESNNCKILDLYLYENQEDTSTVRLDLLFDRPDIKNVLATFERFGYEVIDTSMSQEDWAEIQDRFNALIRYLNT